MLEIADNFPGILLVEDDEGYTRLLRNTLAETDFGQAQLVHANRVEEALGCLAQDRLDVVLLDLSLPDCQGVETVQRIRHAAPDVPIVVLTSIDDGALALAALREGAQDYLVKVNVDSHVLERSIRYAMERTQTLRAIREYEHRYRALFEQTNDAVFLISLEGVYLAVNQRAADMLGYEVAELVGKSIRYNIAPEDEFKSQGVLEALKAGQMLPVYQRLFQRKNGTVFPVEINASLVRDGVGRPLYIQSIVRDITERRQAQAELEMSLSLLRATLESTADGMLVVDRQGNMVGYNQKFVEMWGIPETVMAARDDGQALNYVLSQLKDPDGFLEKVRQLYSEPAAESYDTLEFLDGRLFERYSQAQRVGDAIVGRVWSFRDVTERKRAEEAEREQRVLAEALRDAAAALNSTLELEEVLERILMLIGRVIPHDSANVMLIEDGVAHIVRHVGYRERGLEEPDAALRPVIDNSSALRRVQETGEPLVVPDTTHHVDWAPLPGPDWIRSYLGAPILAKGQVIGILNLESTTPNSFSQTHAKILQAFSDQASIAIRNARLFEATRSHAGELAALYRATSALFTSETVPGMARQIAWTVVKAFAQVDCGVMVVDRVNGQVVRLARAGDYRMDTLAPLYLDGPGLVPEAIRTREPVYAPDAARDRRYVPNDPRTRSELVIPLQTSKGVLGVLDLQSQRLNAFPDRDQRILRAFAERAAAALENAQLVEEIRGYASELEQRVAERTFQLKQAKDRVEAIFNNSSDAILVLDSQTAIQQHNPAFNDLFGYPEASLLGQPFTLLVEPEQADVLAQTFHAVMADRQPRRVEVSARRRDGKRFAADVALSPIVEGGAQVSVICSVRDVTDRKRAELELRTALDHEREIGELRSHFISSASHEFRTPLAKIMVASDMLKLYSEKLSDEQKTYRLTSIQAEVRAMTRLLDNLLKISQVAIADKAPFNPAPIDLVAFCQEVWDEVQQSTRAEQPLIFTHDGLCAEAVVDENLLHAILTHILSNAVKFSPSESQIFLELDCAAQQVIFRIRDRGIGIPQEDARQVYNPFYRGKNAGDYSGAGLGLTIVKEYVEAHRGTITFESALDKGTTFTVTVPNGLLKDMSNGKDTGD